MNTAESGWRRNDSPRQTMQQPELLGQLRSLVRVSTPPFRIDTAAWTPRFTAGAPLLRLPSANGDNPFAPGRMLAYRSLYSKVVPWERQYPVEDFGSPLIGAANVAYIVHDGALESAPLLARGWEPVEVASSRPIAVFRNPRVLPRYRVVHDARPAMSADEALGALEKIDPARTVVVEGWRGALNAAVGASPVEVRAWSPETVELRVALERPGFLVAADGWARGWTASVDGRPAEVFPANVAFMGLPVPAGEHIVRLAYRPASVYWWGAISALAWIVAVVCGNRLPSG
jgi:hypothetical protein